MNEKLTEEKFRQFVREAIATRSYSNIIDKIVEKVFPKPEIVFEELNSGRLKLSMAGVKGHYQYYIYETLWNFHNTYCVTVINKRGDYLDTKSFNTEEDRLNYIYEKEREG